MTSRARGTRTSGRSGTTRCGAILASAPGVASTRWREGGAREGTERTSTSSIPSLQEPPIDQTLAVRSQCGLQCAVTNRYGGFLKSTSSARVLLKHLHHTQACVFCKAKRKGVFGKPFVWDSNFALIRFVFGFIVPPAGRCPV